MTFPDLNFNSKQGLGRVYDTLKAYYPNPTPVESLINIYSKEATMRTAISIVSSRLKSSGLTIRKVKGGYGIFDINNAPKSYYEGTRWKAPKGMVKQLFDIFKSGARLSTLEIGQLLWPQYTDRHRITHAVGQQVSMVRKWLRRENEFLGIIDGKYQIINESTYSREAERRHSGISGHFNNVQDLIVSGVEKHRHNVQLSSQLELLMLNLQDIQSSHRRRLLTNPSNNEVPDQNSAVEQDQARPEPAKETV